MGQELVRIIESGVLSEFLDWRLLRFQVLSVEVTQAIQYLRAAEHLSDPSTRAPDNSVTLIAGKPAWVRVYVRSGLFAGDISNVSGTIEVSLREFPMRYRIIGTISPQPPGTITAHATVEHYDTERSALSSTLNFILPADYMCGNLRLRVRVNAPGGHDDEFTVYLDVTLEQTLRLAGIMVGYNGPVSSAPRAPNINLAAPTLADLQTTSAWTLLTFPVRSDSVATYRTAGTMIWNQPLTDPQIPPGGCSLNWNALLGALQTQRVLDGNHSDVIYYGLLAAGTPMGPVTGCDNPSIGSSSVGNGPAMAHELGHACGLQHAPGCTLGDANYPAYVPYDPPGTKQDSIGEYGLDINNGNIMSPAVFRDVMSYCPGPRWISLYHYGRLTNNSRLDPVYKCVDHPLWQDILLYDWRPKWPPGHPGPEPGWRQRTMSPEPLISIIGVMHSESAVEIISIMRLDSRREITNGRSTDLTAELLSTEGHPIADAPLFRLRSYSRGGCGCHGDGSAESRYPYLFQAFLSNIERGSALRIRRGDTEIWSRHAPSSEPRIADFTARLLRGRGRKGERAADQLRVGWQLESAGEEEPEGMLQWSKDRGRTWYALTTGLRDGSAALDASTLPGGRVLIRLLVSDGFHTTESESVAVQVSQRAPAVSILSPREGQMLIAGSAMRLWGAVTHGDGETVPDENARWQLNGEEIEGGLDVFITGPSAGEHRLTLVVTTDREKGEQTVSFRTVDESLTK